MARGARWQVYLFWLSMAVIMAVAVGFTALEAAHGDWHHVGYMAPILLLVPFSAYLFYERAKSLESLREGNRRSRTLLEEASDPIFVSELGSRRFVLANRRALELTGYSASELRSLRVPDVVDTGEVDLDERRRDLDGGTVLRLRQKVITKQGKEIPVEISASQVSEDLVQAIVRPIGERLEAEQALRRSESLFRAVSEMTSDYAFSLKIGKDGTLVPDWFTEGFERVTGYTVAELEAIGWEQLIHADDLPRVAGSMAGAFQKGQTSSEIEYRFITKSGQVRHMKASYRYEREDAGGPFVRLVGAASDITEQKLLQRDLRESERRYRELYEQLPVGIFRRSAGGVGLEANPAVIELTGYPDRETFLDADPKDFWVDPSDREVWMKLLHERTVVNNYETHFKKYDGTSFWARTTARCVKDSEGRISYIEGVVVDITEEVALDQELRATLQDLRRADAERKRLLTHLVKAKEEERSRVASDIHDDSVQVMTALAIDLERLSRNMPDLQHRAVLEQLEGRARDAVGRLRTMVFELRPPALDQEGVVSALRMYLEEFTIDTGIDYQFRSDLDEEPANPTRVVLYRIAQEALTNVRKHSDATRVVVELHRERSGVAMTITDDGHGFDVGGEELNNPGHIGLSEMRERAEIGGGRFKITSDVDSGTCVAVWVPELSG